MTFVFLFVGQDIDIPTLLTRSIRLHMPDADIIQCTDQTTRAVEGISRVFRSSGDVQNLMTFRLSSFCSLGLDQPAAYVDADMLMVRPLDVEELLGKDDVVACLRSFDRDDIIKTRFRDMDIPEYRNKTVAEVYPYLACFTAVRGHAFWKDCYDELLNLPKKFHYWYGDQEAIRNVIKRGGGHRIKKVPESSLGCLPEYFKPTLNIPYFIHFKGTHRKKLMSEWSKRLGA